MSLLEGVNYYYLSYNELTSLLDYSDPDLLDAGLTITASEIQDLRNDFLENGIAIDSNGVTNFYLGEDHINSKEEELLFVLDLVKMWYVGESSQKFGAPF